MYKKLAIQTIIYSIGLILPKLINYSLLKFFTFYLKREEFSLYTDMYSLSFLIIGFLSFGLENTYFRFLYKKKYYEKITIFSTGIITQFLIITLFLIFFSYYVEELIILAGYVAHPEYFLMFFLIIIIDTICVLPMSWLRIHEKPLVYTFINLFIILIQSLLTTYMFFCYNNLFLLKQNNLFFIFFKLINNFTDKTGCIFLSNTISSIINFFSIFYIFIKYVRIKRFNITISKRMIKYGIPIMLGTISFSINENLDKVLIKRWLSDDINGAYSACYKIAAIMSLYMRVFKLGVEPFFFKKSKKSNSKYYYEEIIYLFILFGLLIYVLICCNIYILVNFLINQRYHFAIPIIPIIMISNLFLGIYTNISIFYKISDKPIIGTYISLTGVLVTFMFNILFILSQSRDFMTPAWGTFTSYGSMLIILYFWSKSKFLNFYRTIIDIFIHLFISMLIISLTNEINSIIINFFVQFIYLTTIFFMEKKRILYLLK